MTNVKKLPSKGAYKDRVQFKSKSGNTYVISRWRRKLVCSCPAFIFGQGKPCKHINEWKAR